MNTCLAAQLNPYKLNSDPNIVREHDGYAEIQKELNKPFGAPNWGKVKKQIEALGKGPGIGVLAAVYYTVATCKTESTSGFAEGLEILVTAFYNDTSGKPAYPMLRWMLSVLRDDIEGLPETLDSLRHLYRCQRMAELLTERLQSEGHIEEVPGIHRLGRVLREKTERVESAMTPVVEEPSEAEPVEPLPTARWPSALIPLLLLAGIAALAAFALYGLPKTPLIDPVLLSPTEAAPRALTPEAIETYRAQTEPQLIQQQRDATHARYMTHIEQLLNPPLQPREAQARELLHTLSQLYPEEPQAAARLQQLDAQAMARQERLQQLQQRFIAARTSAANLEQRLERLRTDANEVTAADWKSLYPMSRDLKNYAISLSPLLGRLGYIEQQLEEGDSQRAEAELNELNEQLMAIAARYRELRQNLTELQTLATIQSNANTVSPR